MYIEVYRIYKRVSMMDEIIIEVKGLYKFYKAGENIVHALDGLDFTINEGEFVAIVGPSGSGKSTLLNMLAGLEKPTKGEIIIGKLILKSLNKTNWWHSDEIM